MISIFLLLIINQGGFFSKKMDKVKSMRDNFYFHDSYKGYSHGCIEIETPAGADMRR
jgi:hypothetical protein